MCLTRRRESSGGRKIDLTRGGLATLLAAMAAVALIPAHPLRASENEPQRPFAQWADLPEQGQLVWGTTYEQSEAYHVWEGNVRYPANIRVDGENYGIDIRQGYFTLDYGITERWAFDINFGATTVGWRAFDNGGIGQATGLIDTTLGVRYQIFREGEDPNLTWMPTITFRAGAVLPGSYDRSVAFAPGNHGVAIEPDLLMRKHFGWPGFGAWSDIFYRWEHTLGNDQYMVSFGFFQQIKSWELDIGYRHFQCISGENLVLGQPQTIQGAYPSIVYPVDVREINDAIDAGFSYTTQKQWKLGFHCRKIFDGSNTDSKFWLGASLDIPFWTPYRKKATD